MGGGWWVLDFARIKLTQPSLAGAGAELGKNKKRKFKKCFKSFLRGFVQENVKIEAVSHLHVYPFLRSSLFFETYAQGCL